MEERYIAAVDLGTSKVAFTVAKINGDDVQILYYKERPADGIRNSVILNPSKAAVPVRAAIEEAEQELGIKISQVVAGLPRFYIREEMAPARLDRTDPDSCISEEEVSDIRDMALDTYSLDDSKRDEIYGAVVQSYATEGYIQSSEDDIIGMTGEYIEGNFKVFIGDGKASSNMDIMMNRVGVTVARKYFVPDQTARAVLNKDELSNGVALIEIGAGVSSVTIFRNNILKHYCSIPFGGKSITNDIRNECGFREDLAENIKFAFGACLPDKLQSMAEKVIQVNNEDGSCDKLPVKYLSEIITARMREIFEALLYDIQESGHATQLRNGIVITGGGANLANCANMLKEMSGLQVRIGFPRTREFSANGCSGIDSTQAVSSIGMILKAKEDKELNCIKTVTATEEKVAVQESGSLLEDELSGTVFEPEKKTGNPKPTKPTGRKKPMITWGKKMMNTVGSMFNDMD